MASLTEALNTFVPALHESLRKCARRAVPVSLGSPFALPTVKGSLGAYEQLEKRGYVNTEKFTVPEEVEQSTGNQKTTTSKTRKTEGDAYVPVNLPLWCSKFGGFGYLPKSHAYPTNLESGTPLLLLAQINFGELRAQWATVSGAEISSTNVFLEEPLWPSRGVLAFYIDPFDDLFGCDFANVGAQKKYRVLYFEDADDMVAPILQRYWGGELSVEQAEDALAELMWSREEQYEEFEKAYTTHESVRDAYQSMSKPDDMSEADYNRIVRARRETMWRADCSEQLKALSAPDWLIPDHPSLWYGNPINQEYPMYLVKNDMPLDMTPLQSVEFASLVVNPALKDHPDARRSAAGEHYALASQFTEAAAEDDEFGDENVYECGYNGNIIGGYPSFTQDDPRSEEDPMPDMLLFGSDECSKKLMWGDAGIGHFFISARNLADRRFGETWFNWDCC